MGFNLLRGSVQGDDLQRVNEELILASASGSSRGAAYRYEDSTVAYGATYRYVLEVVRLDGAADRSTAAARVVVGPRYFLPVLIK